MKLHQLIDKYYQTLLEQLETSRVVLLHPDSRYRSVLIARLMNDPNLNTFYYALGLDDINAHSFVTGMTHDLANQRPTFGRHTNILPESIYEDVYANMGTILETFVHDLSEVNSEHFVFILDEYDRSDDADDVQRFVELLVTVMPPNCTLVINSRTLPRLPWVAMIAEQQATLLLDDQIIDHNFYGVANDDYGNLEIYALGPGFVLLNNQYIDAWEGHLPRLLLFFSLDRPVVTRSDICRAFWPELNAEQAVNVFHVTKRRLHKALELDVLVHQDGNYCLNPELPVYYDVLEFVTALMAGRNEQHPLEMRINAWQRAIDLYRGPFLQGHEDQWVVERRASYRTGYIEALTSMAALWLDRQRPEQALSMYLKALQADPHHELMHQEVLKLYTQLGRRSEAAVHYQRYLEIKAEDNQQPSPETQSVYDEIVA